MKRKIVKDTASDLKKFEERVGKNITPELSEVDFKVPNMEEKDLTPDEGNSEIHVHTGKTTKDGIIDYGAQAARGILFSALIGIPCYTAYSWLSTRNQEDIAQSNLESSQYASQSAQITFDLANREREAKKIAEIGKNTAVKEKEEKVKEAEKATKEKNAAIANAQRTARESELKDKKRLETLLSQRRTELPGFEPTKDYVSDGERSFHIQSLPWKVSLDDEGFWKYISGTSGGLESNKLDYLKIVNLEKERYIPEGTLASLNNGEFDTYIGDVLGEVVREKYGLNAKDKVIYGIRLKNGKPTGRIDLLKKGEVKYTGPNREEIKAKTAKIPQTYKDYVLPFYNKGNDGGKK